MKIPRLIKLWCVTYLLISPGLYASTVIISIPNQLPWVQQNERGEKVGVLVEYLRFVEQQARGQFAFDIQFQSLKRSIHELKQGVRTDLTIAAAPLGSEQATGIKPYAPIFTAAFSLLTFKENLLDLSALQGKNISVLRGGSGCPCPSDKYPFNRVQVNSHIQGMKLLERGRVDAVSGPGIALLSAAQTLDMLRIIAPPINYNWRTMRLWGQISPASPDLIAQAAAAVTSKENLAELKRLIDLNFSSYATATLRIDI